MKKLYPIFKYFVISVISICIILNLIFCYNEESFMAVFALRNLFLYTFLICYIFYNRITLILLIVVVALFWYQFFTAPKSIEYFSNPIIYFTSPLWEILKFYVSRIIGDLVLIIPLFLSSIITLTEIPCRIKIEMEKRNIIN
jgi:Mn2+/Fe2+ NRAMP family transporter